MKALLSKQRTILIFAICIAVLAAPTALQAKVTTIFSSEFSLPSIDGAKPNIGVARPYAGWNNGVTLLAGGSNFSDIPLIYGGIKRYHTEIYALDDAKGAQWRIVGSLPMPMGEGASVTTPRGIVCVGGHRGEIADGTASQECFMMQWNGQTVELEPLPPLPSPALMPACTAWGDVVFVVSGANVWALDLAALQQQASVSTDEICSSKSISGTNSSNRNESTTWQHLATLPAYTGQPVAVVQNSSMQRVSLFVFCGMDEKGASQSSAYELPLDLTAGSGIPLPGEWISLPEQPEGITMIGAMGLPSGNQHILIAGGSNREVWNSEHDDAYYRQPNEAFKFNRDILVYHTVTQQWFTLSQMPIEGRCGAAFVARPDGSKVIAAGEVGPGIRTGKSLIINFSKAGSLHPVALGIIIVFLIGMAAIGLYFMRRNKTSDDYFRAGGRLPWWVVSLSIYATMFSSITFLSIPALSYLTDCRYLIISIGIIAMAPIVTRWYLPYFRKLNLTSAYEYLEMRFNLPCRLFASAAFTLFMVARTAIVAYLPAVAITALVDVDINLVLVIVTVITIVYCTLGGIEAVIWSDCIQSIIMIGSLFFIGGWLIAGTEGGLGGFIDTATTFHKMRALDFVFDITQPCFWVMLVGGLVANLASYTSDQCVVQRYMTTKDEKAARKSILTNGVLSFVNSSLFFLIGVGLFTYFHSNPAQLDVTMPKNDSIFPIFMVNCLPAGVAGVVLASLTAATLSTLSTNLNSAATAITTDFYARLFPNVTDKGKLLCGKVVTIITGVLGGALAIVLANMEVQSIYDQFQRFLGILTSGLACLFLMGLFMPKINGKGAMTGLIANYIVCIILDRAQFIGKPHVQLFGFIGLVTCLIVSPIASRIFAKHEHK